MDQGSPALPPRRLSPQQQQQQQPSFGQNQDEDAPPTPIAKDTILRQSAANRISTADPIQQISLDEDGQKQRIIQKYPSLSLMGSRNSVASSIDDGKSTSGSDIASRSESPNLSRVNAAKLRKNTVSPNATSKQAPVLASTSKAAPSLVSTPMDSAAASPMRKSHGDIYSPPQNIPQRARASYSSPTNYSPHQEQQAGSPVPIYAGGVFLGYNTGVAVPGINVRPVVVRPVANSAFNPSAPAPETVSYQASGKPMVLVQASPPSNVSSMYMQQYQPQPQRPRPQWTPVMPTRGRPPLKNPPSIPNPGYRPPNSPYRPPPMSRPPNFRPTQKQQQHHQQQQQHIQQQHQQQQQHIQQQQQPRPYQVPRPFDPSPSQVQQQRRESVPSRKQEEEKQKQAFKMPRPFDEPSASQQPPQQPVMIQQPVQMQYQQHPNNRASYVPPPQPYQAHMYPHPPPPQMHQQPMLVRPVPGGSRPIPGPGMRPPNPNGLYHPQVSIRPPPIQQQFLDRPPSPKRKASNSMETEAAPVIDRQGSVSPSKELKLDKMDVFNGTPKAAHASLDMNIPESSPSLPIPNAGGLYRQNSINFTPSTSPGTRRSFEKEGESKVAADQTGLTRRISMDDGSLARKGKNVVDTNGDAASEYNESDTGSQFSSSRGSSVHGSNRDSFLQMPDIRPSFVTIARQRKESLTQQLSQQNLVRIMEEMRAEAKGSKDPKVLFEFSKACLAAGEPFIDEGFALLKKVASNGYPEAHFFLGEAYADDGKDSLAYAQFLSAAKRGFAPACYAIGKCAELGKGAKKNMRLALEMYTKAATAGSLDSMYRLGCAEMKGELRLKKDPVKATKWFKRAAAVPNRNHPEPLFELVNIYETGIPPYILQDFAYARGVLQEAVDFGYPPAIYKLGYSLEHGLLGYDVNPPESMRLYTLAMNLGHVEAFLGMAGWHMTGVENFLPQDQEMAFQLVKEAADRGLARAQYTLGYFFEGAIGTPADIECAFQYYTLAAEQGEERAQARLEKANRPRQSARNKSKKKNSFFGGFFSK